MGAQDGPEEPASPQQKDLVPGASSVPGAVLVPGAASVPRAATPTHAEHTDSTNVMVLWRKKNCGTTVPERSRAL